MASILESFDPPYRDALVIEGNVLSDSWSWFIRSLYDRLYPLGIERAFELPNDKSTPFNLEGLKFSFRGVTCVFLEYLVQRVTSDVELTETGILIFVFNPTSQTWSKIVVSEESPDDSGVDISMTAEGQIQCTTSDESGEPKISNLWCRARTLAGKHKFYSSVGAR